MNAKIAMTILELEAALKRKPAEAEVWYDFVYCRPNGMHSWRGDYALPAIGWTNDGTKKVTVAEVLKWLEELQSQMFYGYKGGEYHFDGDMVPHVANSNEVASTVIVDVLNNSLGHVILETAHTLD